MSGDFIAGLDLGQAQDYSALSIVERRGERPFAYHCRYLQRWKLGTPYPAIVQEVANMLAQIPQTLTRPYLILDATGVGRGIVDMFRAFPNLPAQLRAVTITAGEQAGQDGAEYHVPKKDLVSVVEILSQTVPSRLVLPRDLPYRDILVAEFMNFRAHITPSGHVIYGAGGTDGIQGDWRQGAHDDMLLSLALACWWGERGGLVNARAIGPDVGAQWTRLM